MSECTPCGGGRQRIAEFADATTRDIRVDIWTDAPEDEIYRKGEAFALNFQTNTDLYVVIYRIDVDGLVEVLWRSCEVTTVKSWLGWVWLWEAWYEKMSED